MARDKFQVRSIVLKACLCVKKIEGRDPVML